MGFFDFATGFDLYAGSHGTERLNARWEFLVEPFLPEIGGARVLDLASHDGRWCYAFAAAGAREVVGIEARGDLIQQFELYPDPDLRGRIDLRQGDLFEELEAMVRAGERFDVVGVLGILYHVMDHHRLLKLVRLLGPGLVIVDSDFIVARNPMIQLVRERTDQRINTTAHFDGQQVAMVGIPSTRAMEFMAETLGFEITWADWSTSPQAGQRHLGDYFTADRRQRRTCYLRLKQTR